MLEYLDGERYRRFVERFAHSSSSPSAGELPALSERGEAIAHRVADVLPAVTYERMAAVWAYAGPLAEPGAPLVRYHRLRISGKFLRYTLEFFEEVLDPDAKPLIKAVKELQDHLGDLQDAVVSCGVLRTFLTWGTWERPERRRAAWRRRASWSPRRGRATWRSASRSCSAWWRRFPETWEKVNGPGFGRRLADGAGRRAGLSAGGPCRRRLAGRAAVRPAAPGSPAPGPRARRRRRSAPPAGRTRP